MYYKKTIALLKYSLGFLIPCQFVPRGREIWSQDFPPGAGGFGMIWSGALSNPPICPGSGGVGVSIDWCISKLFCLFAFHFHSNRQFYVTSR